MPINFSILIQIGVGLVLLVAGALINRLFERRVRLVVYYGHVGQFHLQIQPPGIVHTHSVVIRNAGRVPAQNVHVQHNGLLVANNIHVSVFPAVPHTTQLLPNNTEEILFASLPAKFQVTVSYLYFPPILAGQINAQIYSDEGPASVIRVLPQEQLPLWLLTVLRILVGVGVLAVCYVLFALLRWLAVGG